VVAGAARAPDRALPAIRRRVLVVDDEPSLTEVLSAILGAHHDVVAVGSGEAALAHLDRDRAFDAILCDVNLRGVSGIEVYQRLRTHHPDLAARIIFMTGGAYAADARCFLEGVANPCLDKPFDLDEVLAVVEGSSLASDTG